MRGSVGQAVYAVADGYVLESKMARGYGRGGSRGGAVVIQHRTGDGTKFTALYGHLKGLKYKKGQKVKAGAVIGYLNNARPPHLHFGIRLGWGLPEDRNPFRGHTHTTKKTYGFVDPIAFLRKHHRLPKPAPAPVAPPVEPPPPADVTPPLDPPSPTDGGAPPLEADAAVAPSGSGD
jgi:murein DD-endopeptidase MepM/ murein hydrolase activator NlpD